MDINNSRRIVEAIADIAEKTKDEQLIQLSAWIKLMREKKQKPSLAVISFNLNHSDRLKMVKKMTGIEIPEEVVNLIEGEPACFILDYNDTPVLLNERSSITGKKEMGLPFDFLKTYRLIICDEIQSEEEWLELTGEIDVGCLITNATMAMTQGERAWLNGFAKCFFAPDEISIILTKTEFLNNEEELTEVHNTIENTLKRLDMERKVFESESDAFDWMTDYLSAPTINERREARILQNGLASAEKRLKLLLDSVVIDDSTILSAIKQLQKRQHYLELAGQMAAESVLANSLNNLKTRMCEGIRDYGQQMGTNVKSKVETTPLDDLESLEDKINGYISSSWDYYIKSMMAKAIEETNAISKKLVNQMEIDAGSMIAELDVSARRTLYSALGLSGFSSELEEDVTLGRFPFSGSDIDEVSVGAITDQLRKETRNMMLLSIPLLFVNPLASVGTVVAAKAYGKFRMNNELTDIRSELAEQVEKACYDSGEFLAKQVEQNIEKEIRIGAVSIKSAYGNLVSQIEKSFDDLKKTQKEKAFLKEYLSNQLNAVFPELRT
ncbi:MAG: hypothetical protein Q4D81_07410 [Eubacteriales bacterium]|nr:hypothetical protein [Eubacteriales bacterium]